MRTSSSRGSVPVLTTPSHALHFLGYSYNWNHERTLSTAGMEGTTDVLVAAPVLSQGTDWNISSPLYDRSAT